MPKISSLPAATTPAGDELLPIVQGGQTRRITVDQLADFSGAVIFTALVPVERYRAPGYTDAQTIQAAVNSGNPLVFGAREYVVNQGETIYNDACHYMRFEGTTLKIGDGAIVNTDANKTNHTAFMQVRGVQGFVMAGHFTLEGNRDNQTYPASTSDFGRGTATLGSAGRRTNGILEFVPATNNATPARAIYIENVIVRNAYLNGLVFWQTEGVRIDGLRSSNNTMNAITAGGVTDFFVNNPRHYRDGWSDAVPTTALPTGYGDRAGIQVREILTSFNAAALGMPMIPVTTYAQINRNVIIRGGTALECGVESWFMRACFPGKLLACHSRNVGYKRLTGNEPGGTPFFAPAHFWCEFGQYEVDVTAYQDVATTAGWLSPVLGVCYSFVGNGYTSTANPMAIAGDFVSSVRAKGFCGLTSGGAKQNNFAKGVLLSSKVRAEVEIEGCTDDPITITNDTNFNLLPPHDVELTATVVNAAANRAVKIQRFQPEGVTVAGVAGDIRIRLKASDIRSDLTGTDDHAILDVDTTMSSYLLDNFEARDLVMDGDNAAGDFNGVRLRCNGASKNIRIEFKRCVNMISAVRTQGFRNLKLAGHVETCFRVLLVDLGTTSVDPDEMDITGINTYDITTEMFLLQNTATRKLKVTRASGAVLRGRVNCKTWGTGSLTTTPDSYAVELGKYYWDRVLNDHGSAAPATNVLDMRRRFSTAAARAAAVPVYAGEIVVQHDTSGVYVARSTAAGDFSLMA